MLYGNRIELLEGVDGSQGFFVGLEDAEPTRAVGCVEGLVYTCVDLVFNNLADLIIEASQNGNVLFDPRDVRDSDHNC